jgi:DNA adenine methylase
VQYIGGKQKSGGQHIAAIVKRFADLVETDEVTDACCGGLSIAYRLARLGLRVEAADACEPLITLYVALQNGWEPPAIVDRATWESYKANPDPADPMTAFCGFGCSRSGAWFSSFVSDYKYTNRRVPAATAARDSLRKKLSDCAGVTFVTRNYEDSPARGVVYCDIPYADSLGYAAVGPFDHARFWSWAIERSKTQPVIVSERVAPASFEVVGEWSLQSRLSTGTGARRVERVFVHERWRKIEAAHPSRC